MCLGKNGGIQRPQYLCIIDIANFETDFANILILIQIFVNAGLIYGATKRYQWLFIPWMLIYLPAILALLIFCSIQFAVLEGQQLSAILLVIVSSYFYAIVVSSYIELKLQNKILKVNGNWIYFNFWASAKNKYWRDLKKNPNTVMIKKSGTWISKASKH